MRIIKPILLLVAIALLTMGVSYAAASAAHAEEKKVIPQWVGPWSVTPMSNGMMLVECMGTQFLFDTATCKGKPCYMSCSWDGVVANNMTFTKFSSGTKIH